MDNTEGLAQAMNESGLRDANESLKQRVTRLEGLVALICVGFERQFTIEERELVRAYAHNKT